MFELGHLEKFIYCHQHHDMFPCSGRSQDRSTHLKLEKIRLQVSVPSGTTVLEAAHQNQVGEFWVSIFVGNFVVFTGQVDLEGACEASLACSTCHIILAPDRRVAKWKMSIDMVG